MMMFIMINIKVCSIFSLTWGFPPRGSLWEIQCGLLSYGQDKKTSHHMFKTEAIYLTNTQYLSSIEYYKTSHHIFKTESVYLTNMYFYRKRLQKSVTVVDRRTHTYMHRGHILRMGRRRRRSSSRRFQIRAWLLQFPQVPPYLPCSFYSSLFHAHSCAHCP